MSDVVAQERQPDPAPRLSRVHCIHCAMPVRGGLARCWSCGLDPTRAPRRQEPRLHEAAPGVALPGAPAAAKPRLPRPALLVVGGLLLVLLVVLGSVLVAPTDSTRGVRGLAARFRGEGWQRAGLLGVSAEFPGVPARHPFPVGPGLPRVGASLVATGPNLRTELLVAEVADAGAVLDGPGVVEDLVAGYAASVGGGVIQRVPVPIRGASRLDALLDVEGIPVRVRATLVGTTGYVMVVTGPPEAFERFIGSFHGPA